MEPEVIGLMWFGISFVMVLVIKLPLGVALGLSGFLGLWQILGFDKATSIVALNSYGSVDKYITSCIPVFILMGAIVGIGGMGDGLFTSLRKWVGHWPGGLASSTILTCGGFAAVCGSSLATVAAMGTVAYPEMRKYNYDNKLATGCIAAGGCLGGMIPPSVPLVLIAWLTEQPAGPILMAGFLPGVLQIAIFIIMITIVAYRIPTYGPKTNASSWKERFANLPNLLPIFGMFLIVMGGIYLGIFTPTEGAAAGAFIAIAYAVAKRKINRHNISRILERTGLATGSILIIIVGAMIFNTLIVVSGLAAYVVDWVNGFMVSPWVTFALIVLVLTVLGCVMDTLAMILLAIPLLFPIALAQGFNPIWLAIMMECMIEISNITPPVGMVIFTLKAVIVDVEDVPLTTMFKGVAPFVGCYYVSIVIMSIFPQIILVVPNIMKG